MKEWSPGTLLLGQLRRLTREGFDLNDLKSAVELRDGLLGSPTARVDDTTFLGFESEEMAVMFLERLASGEGSAAPIGDRLALAIRATLEVNRRGASKPIADALLGLIRRLREFEISEFSSLQAVVRVLESEISHLR